MFEWTNSHKPVRFIVFFVQHIFYLSASLLFNTKSCNFRLIFSLLHSNVSKNSYAKSKSQVLLLKKIMKCHILFFAWNFDTGKSIHTTSKYGVDHRACFLNHLAGNSKPQPDIWLEFYSGTGKFRFRSYVPFNIIWLQWLEIF